MNNDEFLAESVVERTVRVLFVRSVCQTKFWAHSIIPLLTTSTFTSVVRVENFRPGIIRTVSGKYGELQDLPPGSPPTARRQRCRIFSTVVAQQGSSHREQQSTTYRK